MSERPKLDNETMKMVTGMVVESFTTMLAQRAREAARVCPTAMSGGDALLAFAKTIESLNQEFYGTREKGSA